MADDPSLFTDRELALSAGHAVRRGEDLEALQMFRVLLMRSARVLEPYRQGYRHAVADVLDSFEVAERAEKARNASTEKFELTELQLELAMCLEQKERLSVSELAKAVGRDASQVSRALTTLRDQEVVELDSKRSRDARARIYQLTERGRQALVSVPSSAPNGAHADKSPDELLKRQLRVIFQLFVTKYHYIDNLHWVVEGLGAVYPELDTEMSRKVMRIRRNPVARKLLEDRDDDGTQTCLKLLDQLRLPGLVVVMRRGTSSKDQPPIAELLTAYIQLPAHYDETATMLACEEDIYHFAHGQAGEVAANTRIVVPDSKYGIDANSVKRALAEAMVEHAMGLFSLTCLYDREGEIERRIIYRRCTFRDRKAAIVIYSSEQVGASDVGQLLELMDEHAPDAEVKAA